MWERFKRFWKRHLTLIDISVFIYGVEIFERKELYSYAMAHYQGVDDEHIEQLSWFCLKHYSAVNKFSYSRSNNKLFLNLINFFLQTLKAFEIPSYFNTNKFQKIDGISNVTLSQSSIRNFAWDAFCILPHSFKNIWLILVHFSS